jgi:hypothetical protein
MRFHSRTIDRSFEGSDRVCTLRLLSLKCAALLSALMMLAVKLEFANLNALGAQKKTKQANSAEELLQINISKELGPFTAHLLLMRG